jgi:hypothetical protein
MWLRALYALTGAVLEDGLNVFLVADVVPPAISCEVPRDRPVCVEVREIANFLSERDSVPVCEGAFS